MSEEIQVLQIHRGNNEFDYYQVTVTVNETVSIVEWQGDVLPFNNETGLGFGKAAGCKLVADMTPELMEKVHQTQIKAQEMRVKQIRQVFRNKKWADDLSDDAVDHLHWVVEKLRNEDDNVFLGRLHSFLANYEV